MSSSAQRFGTASVIVVLKAVINDELAAWHEVDLCCGLEQFNAEVRCTPGAARGEIELARTRLRKRDQLFQRSDRDRGMDDQDHRC